MSITIKFTRTIWKTGNSLVVALPLELLKAYGLKEGDEVEVYSKNGEITLKKKAGEN